MKTWKKGFKTELEAEKYLKVANRESGGGCFIKRVQRRSDVYKIFASLGEYEKYLKVREQTGQNTHIKIRGSVL